MKKLFLVSAISAALMACNSDDSSPLITEPTPQNVEGSIELVDLNSATVTVNGHTYSVDNVVYNGAVLQINDLKKDMTVVITPTANGVSSDNMQTYSGQDETQVRLNPTITGVITVLNGNTFTINGIELTFVHLSDDIEVGDWVMVSSLPAADGGYTVLSVVEFDQGLFDEDEIEGPISQLNESAYTFTIAGTIHIDYSNADIDDNQQLTNGQWLEVKGEWDETSAVFKAAEIEVEDYDDLGDDNEIEGVITWVANDKTSFELNSRGRFLINSQTEFDDGSRNQLIAGQMVEVNSVRQGEHRLATEIEFDERDNDDWDQFEFEEQTGVISNATNSDSGTLISFKINGMTILTDAKTTYDDDLNRYNIVNGMVLEVEGVIIGGIDGDNVAREIELNDDQDDDNNI